MMRVRVLIVDDDSAKVERVRAQVEDALGGAVDVAVAGTAAQAAAQIREFDQFDLMVLDLLLPRRQGDAPAPDAGVAFLDELIRRVDLPKPHHVIGLSADADARARSATLFASESWSILEYAPGLSTWSEALRRKLHYILAARSAPGPVGGDYDFDVAIVTALAEPELRAVHDLPIDWQAFDSGHGLPGCKHAELNGMRLVCGSPSGMGMALTAAFSTNIIRSFRPRYVCMTGIAAGVRKNVSIGDAIVATLCWDYGSGKISEDDDGGKLFRPDPRPLSIQPWLSTLLQSEIVESKLPHAVQRAWPAARPGEFNVRFGPLACGAAVVQDPSVADALVESQQRKLLGIDMESYGLFVAADWGMPKPSAVVIKSVVDFADRDKSDTFQHYGAFTSARLLYELICRGLLP